MRRGVDAAKTGGCRMEVDGEAAASGLVEGLSDRRL